MKENVCTSDRRIIKFDIQVQAPAIFVYIQINHPAVDKYALSNNGFMQLDNMQSIDLTLKDPKCDIDINVENIEILTVNDWTSGSVSCALHTLLKSVNIYLCIKYVLKIIKVV